MTAYIDPAALRCGNCGDPLRDGFSPTALVHVATGRARCDGGTLSGHSRTAPFVHAMAVPA